MGTHLQSLKSNLQREGGNNNMASSKHPIIQELMRGADRPAGLLDIEKDRMAGKPLSEFDETRLRNQQLRRTRRLYLRTMTLSEREPLWRVGSQYPDGTARQARAWFRLNNFLYNFGDGVFKKLGWVYGAGTPVNALLGSGRLLWQFTKYMAVIPPTLGVLMYFNEWPGYVTKTNMKNGWYCIPPPCYPGDKTITAQYSQLKLTNGRRSAELRNSESVALPEGSRYDWIANKVVLPEDVPEAVAKRRLKPMDF